MGNFLSDFGGGLLGQGPGSESMSGYEMLPTEKRQGLDRLRSFLSDDPNDLSRGWGAFFAPGYQALPQGERDTRVEELGNVYKAQFNPFLQRVMTEADANLSKAGLYSSGRSSYLKGKIGSDLALSSMLPTVQYKHQLSDTNRSETLRNQLGILDRALGTDYPGQVEIDKPQSVERGLGSLVGRGATAYATGGLSEFGTPFQVGYGSGPRRPRYDPSMESRGAWFD